MTEDWGKRRQGHSPGPPRGRTKPARPTPRRQRWGLLGLPLVLWLAAPGCRVGSGGDPDAGSTVDASPLDAAPPPDASALTDAAGPDAGDGAVEVDATVDAAVPCSVDGEVGECLDVALCDGVSTPGFCPGPAEIQCCTPFPWGCDPDAHPQPNAGLTEPPGLGGCPPGMAPVDTFCMDRYEAALLRVYPDQSTGPWSPYHNPGTLRVRAVSLPAAVPQGYLNGEQAAAACAEAGKRLCTDSEWLRACQGPAGWTYPYGDARQPGVCADARAEHPAIQYFGTSDSWIWSELGHPCLNRLPDSLSPTGAHAGCVSADGIFDLMGNLHEWTADPAGTFRGGFYVDTTLNGEGCLYRTTAHNTLHWDYSTGFRCCAD